MISNFVSQQYL